MRKTPSRKHQRELAELAEIEQKLGQLKHDGEAAEKLRQLVQRRRRTIEAEIEAED